MKRGTVILIGLLLLIAATNLSYGQYMNKLHDYDTTTDWGLDVFLKGDGTYFIIGSAQTSGKPSSIINTNISSDGNTIISKYRVWDDSAALGVGDYGQTKKLPNGGYIVPLIIQYPNYVTGYLYSKGGLLKYNSDGDTVFMKTYTDTTLYFERILNCDVMPDGGYIGGGTHALNTPSYFPALIMRTDSIGDTLWTHTYQKYPTQAALINSVLARPDGRIVAGARSKYDVITPSLDVYYHYTPWFLLLDGAGNIVRDTIYGSKYCGEGRLFKDTIAGYVHTGRIDTLAVPMYPDDYQNFPSYIAHLDTNFRMSWITRFPYTTDGRRYAFGVTQAHDGNYLAYGVSNKWPKSLAWGAKVNRDDGAIIWNKYYVSDSSYAAYFTDVVEKSDGSLLFVGSTFNDTCASWKQSADLWLVGTDSNGCLVPDCDIITKVPQITAANSQPVSIYPNPTTGAITVNAQQSGELIIYNIQGQVVTTHKLKSGTTEIHLPASAGAGMYICRYVSDAGDKSPVVIRLVFSP